MLPDLRRLVTASRQLDTAYLHPRSTKQLLTDQEKRAIDDFRKTLAHFPSVEDPPLTIPPLPYL